MGKSGKYLECHISLARGDATVIVGTKHRHPRHGFGIFDRQPGAYIENNSPIGEAIARFDSSVPKTRGDAYVGAEHRDLVEWINKAKEYEGWITVYRDTSYSSPSIRAHVVYLGPEMKTEMRGFDIPNDRVLRGFINVLDVYLSEYEYEARLLRDYVPIEYVCREWQISEESLMRKIATGNTLVNSVKIGGLYLFDVVGLSNIGPYISRSLHWGAHGTVPICNVRSRMDIAEEFGVLSENVRRLVDSGSVAMVQVTSARSLYYKIEDVKS